MWSKLSDLKRKILTFVIDRVQNIVAFSGLEVLLGDDKVHTRQIYRVLECRICLF